MHMHHLWGRVSLTVAYTYPVCVCVTGQQVGGRYSNNDGDDDM